MSAYDKLMAFQRQTEALAQVAGRLGWDQETMMPRGAAEQRSEEMGAMEGILHARRTDPRKTSACLSCVAGRCRHCRDYVVRSCVPCAIDEGYRVVCCY